MRYLSLFSGIEAATAAWQPMGWQCVGFSEIEPFPCAVLKHYYPQIPNLGDVTEITETQIKKLGQIDLVVFGSPCQDLSVAGNRKGFDGERSSLFRDAIRIIKWARKNNGCRFALWENVPGAFSSNKGADFAEVLKLLTGTVQHKPEKWQNTGIAFGNQGLVEWRVLDAQYFGVPQRRRRIFALADFGDWTGREPVLFESASVSGDSKASREAGQSFAAPVSGSINCTSTGISGTVSSKWYKGTGGPAGDEHYNLITIPIDDRATGDSHDVFCGTQNDAFRDLTKNKAPTMRSGSNGGTVNPVVCFQQNQREQVRLTGNGGQVASALAANAGMKNTNYTHKKTVVRRLTPRECERLQGFRDDYTRIPWRNKPAEACPDGPRYKALGNSIAVPVLEWIARRMDSVLMMDSESTA